LSVGPSVVVGAMDVSHAPPETPAMKMVWSPPNVGGRALRPPVVARVRHSACSQNFRATFGGNKGPPMGTVVIGQGANRTNQTGISPREAFNRLPRESTVPRESTAPRESTTGCCSSDLLEREATAPARMKNGASTTIRSATISPPPRFRAIPAVGAVPLPRALMPGQQMSVFVPRDFRHSSQPRMMQEHETRGSLPLMAPRRDARQRSPLVVNKRNSSPPRQLSPVIARDIRHQSPTGACRDLRHQSPTGACREFRHQSPSGAYREIRHQSPIGAYREIRRHPPNGNCRELRPHLQIHGRRDSRSPSPIPPAGTTILSPQTTPKVSPRCCPTGTVNLPLVIGRGSPSPSRGGRVPDATTPRSGSPGGSPGVRTPRTERWEFVVGPKEGPIPVRSGLVPPGPGYCQIGTPRVRIKSVSRKPSIKLLQEPSDGGCLKGFIDLTGTNLEDTVTTTADNLEDTMTTAVNTSCESPVPASSGAPGVSQVDLALLRSRLQSLERHMVTELAAGGPESQLGNLALLKSGLEALERVNRRCTVL